MGLRLEAWTYPGAGTFQRRVANVDYTTLTYQEYESAEGSGAFTVDIDYPRLADIVDARSNVVSLMRIFDGETEVGAFFADNVRYEDRAGADAEVGGRSIVRALDDAVVYPFDYATRPLQTRQPDWVYGADNASVVNPGFEEDDGISEGWESGGPNGWSPTSDPAPQDMEVLFGASTARNGDYCLRFDPLAKQSGVRKSFSCEPNRRYTVQAYLKCDTSGQRFTMSVNWEEGATSHLSNDFVTNDRLTVELDGASKGAGASNGTWQSLFLDFTSGDEQTSLDVQIVYDGSLSSGPAANIDDFSLSGGAAGLSPWYPFATVTPVVGDVEVFEINTIFSRSGDNCCTVQVGSSSSAYASGIGQTIPTVGGRSVTGGMWVYHGDAVAHQFAVVLKSEFTNKWISYDTWTVQPNTWTRIWTSGETQGDATELHLRYAEAGGSPVFFVDDAFFYDGLPPATAGGILETLLSEAQNRGSLGWLSWSFTADVDSTGADWDENLAIRIARGSTILQVLEELNSVFGIEWTVRPAGSVYELVVTNKGALDSGLSPSFKLRASTAQRVDRDETVRGRGAVLVEGDDGYLTVDADTALVSAFGRREAYVNNRDVGQQSLLSVATQFLADQGSVVGVEPVLYDRYRPHVDYGVGDTLTYERAGVDSNVRVKSVLTAVDSSGAVSYRVGLEEV